MYTPYAFTNFAGLPGVSGVTDGTGSAARFDTVYGVATDNAGNIYVADGASTIRKITPAGAVATLAGSAGSVGATDGSGSAALFKNPYGVAADSAGNVYVADTGNNTIRKITPAGAVTTLAGSAGPVGATDGSGGAARFNSPYGVAADSTGNVYVADTYNNTIRKITPAGVVTTLAGSAGQMGATDGAGSAARFTWPEGVAVDTAGNVYVADSGNNTIRKITSAGAVTTLAGNPISYGSTDGSGSSALFFWPQGVAVDSAGNVYVAEETNDTIRRVTPTGVTSTLAGSPSQEGSADDIGGAARFYGPVSVAVDGVGNLYVADSNNLRVTKGTQAFFQFSTATGNLTVSNGSFRAWLTGPAGKSVALDVSATLQSWTPLQTNVMPQGGLGLSVPPSTNQHRFLRARPLP